MENDVLKTAAEIKQKNVIDMGLTFSAMIRLFEKNSKRRITGKLYNEFQKIDKINTAENFTAFHDNFCSWFTASVKNAEKTRDGKIIKKSGYAAYGQAAKLLDVVLKVYVYYSSLPDVETAERVRSYLNTSIDNPLLKHLKKAFPDENILAKTVEQIDQETYVKLQRLIKTEIKMIYSDKIVPVQYDDIMWNKLNRTAASV